MALFPPGQAVVSTYSASPSFLSSPDWASIRTAVRSHLPLRNLHWKPASRPSLRTIQSVDVEFRALEMGVNRGEDSERPGPGGSFLEKPLLNIYFVTCEDNDTYKGTVKQQIKDWLSFVSQRKHQEWLIVLVVKPDPTTGAAKGAGGGTAASRLFRVGGSVLDRIRSDFNVGKRDRCVQLSRPAFPAPDDPILWADLIGKMKDGVISCFDSNVAAREEETKAMEGMRKMPGWNFCTFFILKESLAHSFEGMSLYEDAMIQYDELEASFFQVLKERNLSWFGKFGGTAPSDDSASILSISHKPYRDLIVANSISVFDFRIYVFARRCRMLGRMGRTSEVMKQGIEFVRSFGRTLGENSDSLAENFIESWIYSSCLNIVDTCDEWKAALPPKPLLPTSNQEDSMTLATKAELYKLARAQLDKLGVRAGHLPNSYPFNANITPASIPSSSADARGKPVKPANPISRRELYAALSDQATFDVLIQDTTLKAVKCLSTSGKGRSTLELSGSLALLDFHRKHYKSAFSRFQTVATRFGLCDWTSLQAFYLIKTLQCHTILKEPREKEWISAVFELLKSVVRLDPLGRDAVWDGSAGGLTGFLEELTSGLRAAGQTLEKELVLHGHAAFDVRPKTTRARSLGDQDGCTIELVVTNRLPCAVDVDDVRTCLSGRERDQLWFHSGENKLQPGENIILATCHVPVSDLFTFETSEIRISRVSIYYSALPTKFLEHSMRTVLRIPGDRRALDAKVSLPLSVRLDAQPSILLEISTGRNAVRAASIAIQVPNDELTFDLSRAILVSGDQTSFASTSSGVNVEGLKPDSALIISFPYRGTPAGTGVPIRISIDYSTEAQPDVCRALRKTRDLILSLPFAVNVQDIFREECMFSKFTLSSDGHNHIRVSSSQLAGAKSTVEITSSRSPSDPEVVVSPALPATILHRLTLKEGAERAEHDTLRLTISYRTLSEELRHAIQSHLNTLITSLPVLLDNQDWLVRTLISSIESVPGWAGRFLASGKLDVPEIEEPALVRVIRRLGLDDGDVEALADGWRKSVDALDEYEAPVSGPEMPWRTLEIPVDVPIRQVLSAVCLFVVSPGPNAVGQPITCRLSISCSSRWAGGSPPLPQGTMMAYDLGADFGHWLVSGRTKGSFVASEEPFTATFTLIPVHHGTLALPRVNVTPLAVGPGWTGGQAEPSSETYLVNAAETVEVLPVVGRATFVVGQPLALSDDGGRGAGASAGMNGLGGGPIGIEA